MEKCINRHIQSPHCSTGLPLVIAILAALCFISIPASGEPDAPSFCKEGFQAYKSNNFEKALTCANASIKISPRFGYGYCLRGLALMSLKRFDEAALAFDRASRLDPQNPDYPKLLARCLEKQSEPLFNSPDSKSNSPPSLLATTTPTARTVSRITHSTTEGTSGKQGSLLSRLKASFPAPISSSDIEVFRGQNSATLTDEEHKQLHEYKKLSDRRKFEIEALANSEDYGVDGIDSLIVFSPGDDPVEAKFIALVKAGLRMIPGPMRESFRKEGYKVLLVTNISKSISSKVLKEHPRGYPEGATYAEVPAYCDSSTRQIVVVQPSTYSCPDRSVCHELGHAFDHFTGLKMRQGDPPFRMSHSPKFKEAYIRDLQMFPDEYRKTLAYYLQPDQAGQEELFAEMFPLMYCKQPLLGSRQDQLRASFPNVLLDMQNAFNAYD